MGQRLIIPGGGGHYLSDEEILERLLALNLERANPDATHVGRALHLD